MGVVSAMTGKGFGSALGNPWIVAVIAIVFLSLAASLFGAFELALPPSLNNRLSSVGGTGYRGAFLLGLVCGLVAAPCVGPFLFGLLGWIATTRNVALGSAAMALYGLGLGTLFFVVGAFAVNLPKAGAWMMGIKWVGGVCLAYMALAYIRDAMPKETLHKWVQSGAVLRRRRDRPLAIGLALGGVHVAAERRKSRIVAPVEADEARVHRFRPSRASSWSRRGGSFERRPDFGGRRDDGHGVGALAWETSEAAAPARAASEHKPLLVDFGASWCGACKELDEKTFPDPRVRSEGARFVALHVDATDDDDPEVAACGTSMAPSRAFPSCLPSGATAKKRSVLPSTWRPTGS